MHVTPHANGKPLFKTSLQAELLIFTFFPSSATILLVVWSANGDGYSALTSPKVNLLSDDTYQWNWAVSSFGQIEQGVHII